MRIAMAQLAPRLGDVDANTATALETIREATAAGADLVVFPELFLSGYRLQDVEDDVAMEANDERLLRIAASAGEKAVLMGFVESGRVYAHNAAAYFDNGTLKHIHRKLYLVTYAIFEEGKHFRAGTSVRAFDSSAGRQAVLVCNDAWQPQLAWLAVQDGARVLLIPANSADSRFTDIMETERYWRRITQFYASMLSCYVVFVNRVGVEGELDFYGTSHVVDPWGQIVAQAPRGEETVLHVDIDLRHVRERRRQVPLVKEGHLAVVGRELTRLIEDGGGL